MAVSSTRGHVGREWFARDSREVAPELLGATLTRHDDTGDVSIVITEVEAYRGGDDPGSHAFRGVTPRTRVMFEQPGTTFIYLTYGMHRMINIVTGGVGEAAGVLIRAGEVTAGLVHAAQRRPHSSHRDLARGPARLAKALGVELSENGIDVFDGERYSLAIPAQPLPHLRSLRTGVSGPGGLAPFDWRFAAVEPNGAPLPTVSPYRLHPSHRPLQAK